jgi:hypothetical protein
VAYVTSRIPNVVGQLGVNASSPAIAGAARQRLKDTLPVHRVEVKIRHDPAREFGLLVVDPVGGYLGGRDSHRDADVRELLRPLAVSLAYAKSSMPKV